MSQTLIMFLLFLLLFFFPMNIVCLDRDPTGGEFSFNGYLYSEKGPNLNSNNLFRQESTSPEESGQVFYNFPVQFKDSVNGTLYSFSTTFAFAIVRKQDSVRDYGLAFVMSPTRGMSQRFPSSFLGLFNASIMGGSSNHLVAVELDTDKSDKYEDIDDNHVGVDINSLRSVGAASAGYFRDDGTFRNLSLMSGKPVQVWIEYDNIEHLLNVTMHPVHVSKPKIPLLSVEQDLGAYLLEFMYVGFTSSPGSVSSSHYILDWTFKMNGTAPDIDLRRLPKIPGDYQKGIQNLKKILSISLSLSIVTLFIVLVLGIWFLSKRKKFVEMLEDWEVQYGPHRFSYKDLFVATKGFKNSELLGRGGFGKVYKGNLPLSNIQIAVKMVSHDSSQGMREFVAEIATIGHLRHPNLVRLLGYCRRKGELFLVYDFMPKGSLDKYLYHNQQSESLDWSQRFKIVKDVASGLCYLHQQWVQVIIHRDIKPANILLDDNMTAKLGDFGLAKLCDHGIDPLSSHVAGTIGYISPELARTGKASTSSDVYAFGIFMLEISCGRRPIVRRASPVETVLSDWVLSCWENGDILQVLDQRLGHEYLTEQATLVLKLGLLCSHPVPVTRPSMSSVIQFLDGAAQLPHNLLDIIQTRDMNGVLGGSTDSPVISTVPPLSLTESFVSHGR